MVDKELKTKFFNPCSSKLDEELEGELLEEVVELEEEEEDNDEEEEELVFELIVLLLVEEDDEELLVTLPAQLVSNKPKDNIVIKQFLFIFSPYQQFR